MIFSDDTVAVASCEVYLSSIDTVHVYNNTDEEILARWEILQYHFPQGGAYWLIFDPNQYLPFAPHGNVTIEPRDTAWIIFYMYHDTLLQPGDTAFMQIKVFDRMDSINTTQTLTAIQYCPLQTSHLEIPSSFRLEVFPNPVVDEMTIKLPESLDASSASVVLYSVIGERIRQWSINDREVTLPRDGLQGGLYCLAVTVHDHLIGITKIIIGE